MTNNIERIERRFIWSGWMRLAHWSIALSTLVLMLTSWLIKYAPSIVQPAVDYHQIAGAILALGLLLRIALLFYDKKTGSLGSLIPTKTSIEGMLPMIKFYLSLGKFPLPGWYSHNPLWVPLYGLILLILIAMAATGFLMNSSPVFSGVYLPTLHKGLAFFVWLFTIGHIAAVIMHDTKGNHADISGMLNGYKIYLVEETKPTETTATTQRIDIGQIGKYKPSKKTDPVKTDK